MSKKPEKLVAVTDKCIGAANFCEEKVTASTHFPSLQQVIRRPDVI